MDNFAADTIQLLGRLAQIADAMDKREDQTSTFVEARYTVEECRKARRIIKHMTNVFAERRKTMMQVEVPT